MYLVTWCWVQDGDPLYPNNFVEFVDMTPDEATELEGTLTKAEELEIIEFSEVTLVSERRVTPFKDFSYRNIEHFIYDN